MSSKGSPRQQLLKLAGIFLRIVPARPLRNLVAGLAIAKARSMAPKDGLRLLFWIDSAIYPTMGQLAIKYGDGTHVKHRLIGYHEFFIARITAGERVLDVGCGIGAVAHDIASRCAASVLGVDLNEQNLAVAREAYAHPKVRYIYGDVLQALPDERFDVVVLSNVLEHLPGRAAFLRRLAETSGAARFLIRVPLFERDWRVPLKEELGIEHRLDPTHEIEYTLETFEQEMNEAGLAIAHLEVRWGEIWAEVRPT